MEKEKTIHKDDFTKAPLGTMLYDLRFGYVKLDNIIENAFHPVVCSKGAEIYSYTYDGREEITHIGQLLYWNKPNIVAPEKPFSLKEELLNFNGGPKFDYEITVKDPHTNVTWDDQDLYITFTWDDEDKRITVFYKNMVGEWRIMPTVPFWKAVNVNDFLEKLNNNFIDKEMFIEAMQDIVK